MGYRVPGNEKKGGIFLFSAVVITLCSLCTRHLLCVGEHAFRGRSCMNWAASNYPWSAGDVSRHSELSILFIFSGVALLCWCKDCFMLTIHMKMGKGDKGEELLHQELGPAQASH